MKKYKIKYQEEGILKEKIIETSNLGNELLPKNIVEIKDFKKDLKVNLNFNFFNKIRIDDKKMNLLFYELNLMIQSNINISDALDILIKNKKDKNIKEFLNSIKSSLSGAQAIDEILEKFKINHLIISFLKISQDSGNLALNMKALSNLLIKNYEIKKSFYKAISYPIFLIISFLLSLISIFIFVVPNFKTIFLQINGELPLATRILLKVEYIFINYYYFIFMGILFSLFFIVLLYKSNKKISYFFNKLLVEKIYLIKDIYLSMELYKVFLTIDLMLDSKYEFHKSFQSSRILLKNKYLLDKMYIIDNLIENGKSIKVSFYESGIFDDIVLNLVNTGEVSNSLPLVISEIKMIYKNRFDEKMSFLISLIQPIFLISIMLLILWIVVAIFVPIWDMGNMIK